MRLEYIKLENFALLRAGMNITEIELDFRKAPNGINLIIGNNGTGKTGLLSNLHPFATLGHLEARDDQDLIIPGKDGRKFAIFSTKKHSYEVEHFYKWQGENNSRQIKSYFRKDGKELNSPGTVKSFLEIVQREMDIDINFLKLIRLGGNVKNFIELTSSERFTFIGKLLVAVDKYLSANKKFRSRASALNTLMSNIIEKKTHLGIPDIKIAEELLEKKTKLLSDLKKEKEDQIAEFYTYKGKVNIEELDQANEKSIKLMEEISSLIDDKKKLQKPRLKYIDSGIEVHATLLYKIRSLQQKREIIMTRYSEELVELSEVTAEIDKYTNISNVALNKVKLASTQEFINKLTDKICEYRSSYKEDPTMEKDKLKSDVDKINMIYFHYDNIMNIGSNGRMLFCKKMLEYEDIGTVHEYLNKTLMDLKTERKLLSIKAPKKKGIMFVPSKCTQYNECPYYKSYSSSNQTISKEGLDSDIEKFEDASATAHSFYSILKILSMRDIDITEYQITDKNILNAIIKMDKRLIVDYQKIQDILTHIESYEEYKTNLILKEKMELELNMQLNKSDGNTKEQLEEIISTLQVKKSQIQNRTNETRKDIKDIIDQVSELQNRAEDYTIYINYNSMCKKINNEIEIKTNDLQKLKSLIELRVSYLQVKEKYNRKMDELAYRIEETEKGINDDKMKIDLFKRLEKEIEEIKEKYNNIIDLRDVTSISDGIPMIHIKLYCRALCTIANNIIKSIYHGDFRIKKFDIREGVFNIPYYTKGFTVKDIRDTSQAEASVAKLAISFAILSQFMTKYNIPLLDEVDGPMHQINKERFFSSIEGILKDVLKCEQAFLITQSTMFNEYPVNFIVTDFEYKHLIPKDATVIFQR